MQRAKSSDLTQRAQRSIPGGVNSPVRAFKAVGGEPPFIASANGAYVTDMGAPSGSVMFRQMTSDADLVAIHFTEVENGVKTFYAGARASGLAIFQSVAEMLGGIATGGSVSWGGEGASSVAGGSWRVRRLGASPSVSSAGDSSQSRS